MPDREVADEPVATLQIGTVASDEQAASLLQYLREEFHIGLEHTTESTRHYAVYATEDTQPWVRVGDTVSPELVATDGGTFSRQECRNCGTSLEHIGKGDPAHGGHHPTLFRCPNPRCPLDEVTRG